MSPKLNAPLKKLRRNLLKSFKGKNEPLVKRPSDEEEPLPPPSSLTKATSDVKAPGTTIRKNDSPTTITVDIFPTSSVAPSSPERRLRDNIGKFLYEDNNKGRNRSKEDRSPRDSYHESLPQRKLFPPMAPDDELSADLSNKTNVDAQVVQAQPNNPSISIRNRIHISDEEFHKGIPPTIPLQPPQEYVKPDIYFFPTDFKFPSFGDTFTEAQSTLSKQLFKKPTFEATTTSFTSNSHQLKSDSLTAITEETASESNSDKKNSHQHLSSSRMIPAESKYTYEKGSILDPYFDLEDDDSIFADLPSSINLDAQENAIYNTYMNESSTLYASDDEFIRGGRGCQVDGEECVYFMDVGCSNFQEGLLKGLQRMLFDSKKKNLSSVASMTSSTLLSRSFSKESRSTTRNRLSDDLMIAKSYASMTFSDDGSYSSVQSDPYGRRGHNRSSRKSSSKKKNKKKTKGRKICQKVVSFEDENARRKITEKVVSFDDEFNEEVINQW